MLTNVFIIILAICKSSFEKFYSGHFSTFKSANFFSVPYKFTKLIFCQTNTSQMFSPILWVVSLLFIVSFAFSFDLSQLINLYICFLWFWDLVQKNLFPQQCSVSSYLFFFLFHILGLTFNSLITFKLIFCKFKERDLVSWFCIWMSKFPSTTDWRESLFSNIWSCCICQKSSWV